jgi:hypothetical protein
MAGCKPKGGADPPKPVDWFAVALARRKRVIDLGRRGELYEEWLVYHKANPQVYLLVCQRCQQLIDHGITEYAIGTIWETMRWHLDVEADDKEFKLPNNHRAYYARHWMQEHPQYGEASGQPFFRLATLRSVMPKPRDRYGRVFDVADMVDQEDDE